VASAAAEVLREEDLGRWSRLVAESPDGSIYSLPGYLDALCTAVGGRFSVLAVRQGDELGGGVALYERDARAGPYVAPRLLLYYNGIVLRRHATKYPSEQTARDVKVLAALAEALRARRFSRLALRSRSSFTDTRPFTGAGFVASPSYSYVVPIDDLALAWSRVEQNLKRLVKRCEAASMAVSDDEDFDSFHRLHASTVARKGMEEYMPERTFRAFFEGLRRSGLCRLFHCRLPDGRSVAAQLVLLGPGPTSHSVAAAADPEYARAGANAFLRWKVFEALHALGSRANDLTDASLNPVTHFKSQLGGRLETCFVVESPPSLRSRIAGGARAIVRWARRARRPPGGG